MHQVAPPVADDIAPQSLRSRRRTETLQVIHQAATGLVTEQGLASTTVDHIAAASGVSPRTVFNYYATKEDAVLGLISPTASAAATEWFVQHAAEPLLLDRTVAMLASILQSMNIPGIDITTRRPLFEAFPELLQTLHARVTEASKVLDDCLQLLPEALGLTPIQRHALRSAATAIVQEAFILVAHARFPTQADLEKALSAHRDVLGR